MAKNGEKKITKLEVVKTAKLELKKSASGIMTIPGVRTDRFSTLIIGTAPLVCHKFAQKLRDQILAKHKGEASAGREQKDPHANFEAARYRLTDGGDGLPAGGLKACIVKGFNKQSGVPMTKAKGAIRIEADDMATNLVRILGPKNPRAATMVEEAGTWPNMREDVVRNQSGVVDIRHRPQYWPWACLLSIEHVPAVASMAQVLQAVALSGFVEGLCEWRPGSKESLSGSLGTFRLATAEEAALFEQDRLFDELEISTNKKPPTNGRKKKVA
jgi:hypothetical protein